MLEMLFQFYFDSQALVFGGFLAGLFTLVSVLMFLEEPSSAAARWVIFSPLLFFLWPVVGGGALLFGLSYLVKNVVLRALPTPEEKRAFKRVFRRSSEPGCGMLSESEVKAEEGGLSIHE